MLTIPSVFFFFFLIAQEMTAPTHQTLLSALPLDDQSRKREREETKPATRMSIPSEFPSSWKNSVVAAVKMEQLKEDRIPLGGGAHGNVFRCELPDGNMIAVKKCGRKKRHLDHDMFLQEAMILKRQRHPHVVDYLFGDYDSERKSGELHIYLEYCDHTLLDEVQKTGGISESEAVCIVRQLVSVLNDLHSSGVVHRDVKCDNVLLTESKMVKLADFSLSVDETFRRDANSVGTEEYLPPEVLSMMNEKQFGTPCGCDPSADVYSLGITTFVIMNKGYLPWSSARTERHEQVLSREPLALPPDWSEPSKDFIWRCSSYEPRNRPTMAELLGHPWIAPRRPPLELGNTGANSSVAIRRGESQHC